jgi:nucleoside-diphosphate kinase
MNIELTLALIKPDATASGHSGDIIRAIEESGFEIKRMTKKQLTRAEAEKFYAVHSSRSFFGELVEFISSGPLIAVALERENAVAVWRELMGDTNPEKAFFGSLRRRFGTSIGANATHGSDSVENAKIEIAQFFSDLV